MSWDVFIWKTPTTDGGFQEKAVDTLENTLASQVNFSIDAVNAGDTPSGSNKCDDSDNRKDWFENYLESNNLYKEGAHHIMLVDCRDVFQSEAYRNMKHDPSDYKWWVTPYAVSISNVAVAVLGKNRFKNTLMQEFAHTCLDYNKCPWSEPGYEEHSCGGVVYDRYGWEYESRVTPMLTSYENQMSDSRYCVSDTGSAQGFTTNITDCTKEGLESYHDSN